MERRQLFSAGDLDPIFAGNGKLTTDWESLGATSDFARDIAVQNDGKILVLLPQDLVRYNADGTIDTAFGGGDGMADVFFESFPDAFAMALQADGKIVVVGEDDSLNDSTEFGVQRFTSAGLPDTTFAGDSRLTFGFDSKFSDARDVAIQNDGKIVVVGNALTGLFDADHDFAIARLNANGTFDNTFNGGGRKIVGFGETEDATDVAIDYNGTPGTNPNYGTIVLAGWRSIDFNGTDFAVARLLSNGNLDSSFGGGDGQVITDFGYDNEYPAGLLIPTAGKPVIAGDVGTGSSNFALMRYNANGTLDTTFGANGNGKVETNISGHDEAGSLIQSFGNKLLVGGSSNFRQNFTIVAYTSDGHIDTHFGGGDGIVITNFSGVTAARALANYPYNNPDSLREDRFVAAGYSNGNTAVARYIDLGPAVSITALDGTGSESGSNTASFIVSRDAFLNFTTRVYYSVGGTANPPGSFPTNTVDYTGIPSIPALRYVDILPGNNFAALTITPNDDTRVEGDETAIFTVQSSNSYVHDNPESTTLVILDNETTGPVVIDSAFEYNLGAPQHLRFRFSQNVNSSLAAGDLAVQLLGPGGGSIPFAAPVYDNSTNTATFSFLSVLANGNYTATLTAAGVTNSIGTPMASNHQLNFFFLRGDANHDRTVDTMDFGALATNFGLSPRVFSQGDFDYSRTVDTIDFAILSTNFNQVLAPASPTTAPAGAPSPGWEPMPDMTTGQLASSIFGEETIALPI